MQSIVDFISDITSIDSKGYVEIRELSSNIKQYYINRASLANVLPRFTSKIDTYFSIFTRTARAGTSAAAGHTSAFVVDIDLKDNTLSTDAYTQYTQLLMPTYIIFSGRGFHLYFCLNAPVEPTTWQQLQKDLLTVFHNKYGDIIDTKITDVARVMRLPNTVNSKSGRLCEIVYASGKKYALEEIQQFLREQEHENETHHVRSLSDDTINTICSLLTPFYTEGERHNLVLHLAGTLYKYNVPIEDALRIVTELSKRMNDEEDRTRQVIETYKKDVRSVVSLASYQRCDYNTYKQIIECIKKHTTYTQKISDDIAIHNDTTTHTIRANNTILALFCVNQKQLVVEKDPLSSRETHYITFDITTTYNTTHTLKYPAQHIDDIFRDYSSYIVCSNQKQRALLLRYLHTMPYNIIYTTAQVPGVYLAENNSIHVILPHKYTTVELFDEVYALNKFVQKHYYDIQDIVSTIFLWSTVAPLWYVLKSHNRTIPYLYLAGESATAKTTLAELFISRYNNTPLHTADSVRTIARMRHILSGSMFPQAIDEASALLSSQSHTAADAVALLLAAYNNCKVGITLSPAATQTEFYATSLLAFTSNYAVTTPQLLRRMYYILFTKDMQRLNADVKTFVHDAERLSLKHIRAFTLERMQELSTNELHLDFHELGRVLLEPLLPYLPFLKTQHPADITIENVQEVATSVIADLKTLIKKYAHYTYELDKVPFLYVSSDTVYITSAVMTAFAQHLHKECTVRAIYEALKPYSAKYITAKRDVTLALREHLPVCSVPKSVFAVVVMGDESSPMNVIANQYLQAQQTEIQA